jgi:ATP/maltotriose-dependent transcriptional regulator MalT
LPPSASFAYLLANAVYLQGRYDEAETLTRECETACRANDVHSHIMWRATRAKALARRGRVEEAKELAREAVAYGSSSDFLSARGDSCMDLAEVLEIDGDLRGMTAAVEDAIALYELKGNVLAAGQARSRLQALV